MRKVEVSSRNASRCVSARSGEGYAEALERSDRKFAVAVQWHPEDLVDSRPEAKRLFQAFADSL